MAKKEKTSFFGKIMGGNVTDVADDAEVSQVAVTEMEAEELAPEDEVEEQEVVVEEAETEVPAKSNGS